MKIKTHPLNSFWYVKGILTTATLVFVFGTTATRAVAQQRAPWVAPKTAQEVKNPLAGDKSVLADGKVLYTANCAPCHGNKGRGDGPAAAALNPKPADHSSVAVQNESDGALFWKLSEGRNPMPSYKKILTDKQRWELINYIRTLSRSIAK
ncbi:MAG TPA: cytochrome c [Mucilaginibacter sp.]|nr:cytochrome c [Mucilaginibacter sp.]